MDDSQALELPYIGAWTSETALALRDMRRVRRRGFSDRDQRDAVVN